MKPASTALITYLNNARADPDVPLLMTDTFTFTLASGLVLCYTNADVTFTYSGNTYLGNSILVDGLKYKAAIGLEVDQQQITIAARATDTITAGAPFLQALRDGAFDFCQILRQRVFFSDRIGGTAIGAVTLFKGRLGVIDEVGRTSAKLNTNSDLVLLDIDMPRNVYQPTCLHTLYDSGCTLVKNAFGTSGTAGSGSTRLDDQLVGSIAEFPARFDHVHVRRQRRGDGDGGLGCRRHLAHAALSARKRAGGGRWLHRLFRLRPHAWHLPKQVQQSGEFPRLPLRAAAADGDLRGR